MSGGRQTTVHVDAEAPARPRGRLRVLVTNDDGVDSEGLRRLAHGLADDGHEVLVAAPAEDVSGSGTGIGRYDLHDPPGLRPIDLGGAVTAAYALQGPPGMAVMAAALGAFGTPPDLIVSGVNAGLNTGTSIVHSGTVGAAITARTFGRSGLAVSLAPGERWYWETAVSVAVAATRWIATRSATTTLNVNVPGQPRVAGASWARIDAFGHFHVASADPVGKVLGLEVRDRHAGSDPRSDTAVCLGGQVALTLLSPLRGIERADDDATAVVGLQEGR